jgi:hypothetical protein
VYANCAGLLEVVRRSPRRPPLLLAFSIARPSGEPRQNTGADHAVTLLDDVLDSDAVCRLACAHAGRDQHARRSDFAAVQPSSESRAARLPVVAIADAIHARRELVRTVAAATALAQLCVGDDVMFNHKGPPALPHPRGSNGRRDRWPIRRGSALAPTRSFPRRTRSLSAPRSAQTPRRRHRR